MNPEIGDFVRSVDGHMGILTAIENTTCWGPMAFFIEADGRIYHCLMSELLLERGGIHK